MYFRLLLVLLSLIFASSLSRAQIFDIKASDARKIKERKLIVVLADTTHTWGKRNNDLLKSIVPKYWDSISIEFMNLAQVRKLYALKILNILPSNFLLSDLRKILFLKSLTLR